MLLFLLNAIEIGYRFILQTKQKYLIHILSLLASIFRSVGSFSDRDQARVFRNKLKLGLVLGNKFWNIFFPSVCSSNHMQINKKTTLILLTLSNL